MPILCEEREVFVNLGFMSLKLVGEVGRRVKRKRRKNLIVPSETSDPCCQGLLPLVKLSFVGICRPCVIKRTACGSDVFRSSVDSAK